MKKRPKRHKSYVPFFKRKRRFKKQTRDWDDPRYIKWRQEIFKRDNYECSVCGSDRKLEAHHLAGWARFPQYRYLVINGRLLCRKCHDRLHLEHGKNTTARDYKVFKNKYGKNPPSA